MKVLTVFVTSLLLSWNVNSYILGNHTDDVLVYFKKIAQMAQSP